MADQQTTLSPDCPECPRHVVVEPDAAIFYPRFCEAFGFPVGPSGSKSLVLFYELWSCGGVLLQTGRASGCPDQGHHPETLLFNPDYGYLLSVLEACDQVSSVMIYSSHTPCQEPSCQCAQSLLSFLQQHPWVRLDLLFSQLQQPQSPESRAGLRGLAVFWPRLILSPVSGGAWAYLLRRFVRDTPPSALQLPLLPGRVEADWGNTVEIAAITGVCPVFLDLSPRSNEESREGLPWPLVQTHVLTLLPPPHLLTPHCTPFIQTVRGTPPLHPRSLANQGRARPFNVVRHVRLPPLRHRHCAHTSVSPSSALSTPLATIRLPGHPVELVQVTDREVANISQSHHRDSKRSRKSKQN
ncbi:putative C-_U-editing enzyme APOBEC-4 [Aplochiton taeniatus]